MVDFPALMSGPMVRATLREIEQPGSGKTQIRLPAWGEHLKVYSDYFEADMPSGPRRPTIWQSVRPGDRLYVKEGFRRIASGQIKSGYGEVRYGVGFRADDATIWNERVTKIWDLTGHPSRGAMQFDPEPWRSPRHMRKHESRITLVVTATHTEQLDAIGPYDACHEGMPGGGAGDYIKQFREIWQSLHTKPGTCWNDNPEVVVIGFRPVLANIDRMAEAA